MSNRLVPLSGILFVVIAALAIVVLGGSTPDVDASSAKIVSFYTTHYGHQSTAPYVLAIGTLFLAVFGAALWQTLTAETRDAFGKLAGAVILVGTGVAVCGYLVAAAFHLALAEAVHHGMSGGGAQALNALDARGYQPFAIGTAIFLLGAAPLMARTPGVFRWFGWIALVLGVASFTPVGFFAFVGANLWIAVVSILMAVGGAPAETPTPAAAVAPTRSVA
jgi:hypothetical protein